MREFFSGWKRKLGVLTLLMACLFAAAWTRSLGNLDLIYLNGKKTNLIVVSGCQKLQFAAGGRFSLVYPSSQEIPNRQYGVYWQPEKLLPSRSIIDFFEYPASEIKMYTDENGNEEAMIPYWSIVLPLTALSAYLLLSKPRVRTPVPENRV
ncbi:hypothetical protein [Schlesneria paludicola]|uniref:hypothetical protein n=1 Tax=Schlesneria paludicola TaxID=360056 RepID=UPI000299EA53|nr:hypothetical protein [Schlesneria paludicola]